MRLFLFNIALFVTVLFASFSCFAEEKINYTQGVEYKLLTPPQATHEKNKIQVIEFFSYACPHCYHFEPFVRTWLKNKAANVEFVRIPAIFNAKWELLAKVFYTSEALNVTKIMHDKIFDAIHGQRKRINSLDDIKEIFVANGVTASDFDATINSFGVANKLLMAKKLTSSYKVDGVPLIVINGKYRTNSTLAKGHENMLKVTNFLVDKETK